METLTKDTAERASGVTQPGAGSALVRRGERRPHVIVVGGGFAGLNCVRQLGGTDVDVTLIDRHNYHLFQPLLYQVATAALEPADISGPFRQLIRDDNVSVLMGQVEQVDVAARRLTLLDRTLEYDYLVLATGAAHSYFGHDEWAARAPGLKTVEDALEIRRRILYAYEAAERETDAERQRAWLTFVVIGGGPTGVELAGALAEISRQTRAREFRHIDPKRARVVLLEGLPRVLTAYSEELSAKARRSLERLGVEVHTGTMVTSVEGHEVRSKDMTIAARTVLWAAGVAASPLARSLGTELDKAGRVRVTPELTVPGHDEIFVVGDLVNLKLDGKELPGLAPVAMALGTFAAKNIQRSLRGEALEPFRFFDRGSFAVIGRGAAVGVVFNRFALSGVLAWFAWLAIHITFLVGFRNRIAVLFNWAYVYLTQRRHAQLIVGAAPLEEGGERKPAALLRSGEGDGQRSSNGSASQRRAVGH
ncbi:MAG TPA: NAD(P)/FAD-dependent oxidoreductase [Polyangiaceae bacterium]|nr:NAD(P)/FAD-dependent oxidoreductase [Polyangiaceae bacterium]